MIDRPHWGDHPISLLHLIAQATWHSPAFVVGNRLGLTALRDTIDKALQDGEAAIEVSADDGEGYGVHVRCVASDAMADIPLGYTAGYAAGNREWPEWMLRAD